MREKYSERKRRQTTNSILQRLKRLEEISPDRLVILANFDGVEKECSVDELEANPKAVFIRVISGNSLDDVQRILNRIEVIAHDGYN